MNTNRKIKGFYADNKLAVLAVAGLFLLWRFWDLLTGLLGLVKAPLDAATAAAGAASVGVKTKAQAAIDRNTISTSLPPQGPKAPPRYAATAADTLRYRTAAEDCARALGTTPGQLTNILFTDDAALFAAIKPFGRQRLGTGGKALVTLTGTPVLRDLPGRYDYCIAPFYNELTKRSLQADLDGAFPVSPGIASSTAFKERCAFYRKHTRA